MSLLTVLFYILLIILFILGLIYYFIFTIIFLIIFLFIYFFGTFFYPKEGAKKLNEWLKESAFFQGPYYSFGVENIFIFLDKFFTRSLGYFISLYMKYNPYILMATMAATITKSVMDTVSKMPKMSAMSAIPGKMSAMSAIPGKMSAMSAMSAIPGKMSAFSAIPDKIRGKIQK
jgi:hypothetical protein